MAKIHHEPPRPPILFASALIDLGKAFGVIIIASFAIICLSLPRERGLPHCPLQFGRDAVPGALLEAENVGHLDYVDPWNALCHVFGYSSPPRIRVDSSNDVFSEFYAIVHFKAELQQGRIRTRMPPCDVTLQMETTCGRITHLSCELWLSPRLNQQEREECRSLRNNDALDTDMLVRLGQTTMMANASFDKTALSNILESYKHEPSSIILSLIIGIFAAIFILIIFIATVYIILTMGILIIFLFVISRNDLISG